MSYFTLRDGLWTLMVGREDNLMMINPKSPHQQVVRGMGINNVEYGCCSRKPYSQVKINETKSVCCITSET